MGGNIYGAVSADSCSLSTSDISEADYGADLDSILTLGYSSSGSSSTTVNSYMSNSKFSITGGNSDSFSSILSSFSSTTSNISYQYTDWINSLYDEPAPIQGTYIGIHTLLQTLGSFYDGGNLVNNYNNIHNVNLTADQLLNIGDALQQAYNYYSNVLSEDEVKCEYDSDSYSCDDSNGIYFDNQTCSCTCEYDAGMKIMGDCIIIKTMLLVFVSVSSTVLLQFYG